MRRWYAALGVAIACLLLTLGASSSRATRTVGPGAPKLQSASAAALQPTAAAVSSPQEPTPAFGAYAIVGLESLLAIALLCYAFLQRRRATSVPLPRQVVRGRGPPVHRDRMALAP